MIPRLLWWRVRRDEDPGVLLQEMKEADQLRVTVANAFGFEGKAATLVLMERVAPEERELLIHLVNLIKFTADEIRGAA